jgi:hypothetical protein
MANLPRTGFADMARSLDDVLRFAKSQLHLTEELAFRQGLEPEYLALGGLRVMIERVNDARVTLATLVPHETDLRARYL